MPAKNNAIQIVMVVLWIIGMSSVSVTLASQDYTGVLLTTIVTQSSVVGIYVFQVKAFGTVWRFVGGFFAISALWAIFNAIFRLTS